MLHEGMRGLERFMFGNWKRKIFGVWLLLSLLIWIIFVPFVALGVMISAFTVIILWNKGESLKLRISKWKMSSKWKFIWIGTLGAIWVETEFWILARVFDVNIAASTNLLVDFFFTIPWYFFMMVLFWRVQTKYRFSLFQILLLGGLYSWFVEGFFKFLLGSVPLTEVILFTLTFPGNVLSYSAIVFPASFLLRDEILKKAKKKGIGKYLYALLPFIGVLILIPVIIISALLGLS